MGLMSPLLETGALIRGSTVEMRLLVAAGLMAVDDREGAGEAAGATVARGMDGTQAAGNGSGGRARRKRPERTGTRGMVFSGEDSPTEGQPLLGCQRGRMGA